MRTLKLALSAAAMLSLLACSTIPSTVPTVPPVPPQECLKKCEAMPKPADGSDRSLRAWEYEAIDVYGACRRIHETCAGWHLKGQ